MKIPRITLVGAGPGDVELITLKGLRAIESADVILYDDLANPELLNYAPTGCLKLYVGKRGGELSTSQDDINQMLVYYAREYGHVVRLKGGDAFIFGRGYEEISFAHHHDIPTYTIPGVSSFYSVPELANIPLTTRGISRSFFVTTATNMTGELAEEISCAAKTDATVVILMGLSKLKEIALVFTKENKHHLAVAIIQNGSMPNQKVLRTTVGEMCDAVRTHGIAAPAIIVIGAVAGLYPEKYMEMQNIEVTKTQKASLLYKTKKVFSNLRSLVL